MNSCFKINFCKLLFVIKILVLLINSIKSKEWIAEDLAKSVKSRDIISDTNNYLNKNSNSYFNTLQFAREIQDIRNFQVYIFFIDEMSQHYQTKSFLFNKKKDIEKFVKELSFVLLKGNLEAEQNSLFILFSIKDRQNRIRIGKNVKKYLSDTRAENYLKDIRQKLKIADYTGALEDLIYKINWRITKDTTLSDLGETLSTIIIVGFCGCLCCFSCIQKGIFNENSNTESIKDPVAENVLDKIKLISAKNKDKAIFLEENCIICLEEYNKEEKNHFLNMQAQKQDIKKINDCINNKEGKILSQSNKENINSIKIDNNNPKKASVNIENSDPDAEKNKNVLLVDPYNDYHMDIDEKTNLLNKTENNTKRKANNKLSI